MKWTSHSEGIAVGILHLNSQLIGIDVNFACLAGTEVVIEHLHPVPDNLHLHQTTRKVEVNSEYPEASVQAPTGTPPDGIPQAAPPTPPGTILLTF